MGFLDLFKSHEDNYAAVTDPGAHHASLSHEMIAGAAAFEAAKAYEKHCEKTGQPVSHAKAKEFMAAAAGAFIDRMVETKGLDAIETARVKKKAQEHAEEVLTDEY